MKISFWGAARTVTGSCYLVEHNNVKFLVDCGMFQGSKTLKENNYADFPFNITELSFVLLTHSHVDHSGLLPKLYKAGYANPIYATTVSVALSEIMLPDSGHIQEMEIERKNRKRQRAGLPLLEPIYTAADAMSMMTLFKGIEYNQEFSPANGIRVVMRDAGHILGSAMLEIFYEEDGSERKIVFTGDLGRNDQAIVRDPYIIDTADFLVIESTYGNRVHKGNMEKEVDHFSKVINDTIGRGGNVIIPAFAVDRTQDILYMLNEMQSKNMIVKTQVYVDSPMAVKATEIFARFPKYFDRMTAKLFDETGRPPFVLDNLTYVRTAEESQRLNAIKSGCIIISASGMADAGRIKHHLKHNLWRKESSVLFFGYQAEGTLGRRLIEGEKKVTIHGEEIDVKAEIINMEGFSAHADKNDMINWLKQFEKLPGRIFVTHGEESSAEAFADLIKEELQVETIVPYYGNTVELSIVSTTEIADNKEQQRQDELSLLVEINTALQTLAMSKDHDKLMRVRDYLRRIS